jgi:hypothetical protein
VKTQLIEEEVKTVQYNYSKLDGKIREKFGTQAVFAKAMKKSPSTISQKLNNQRDWTRAEIVLACELLGIPLEEAVSYFFAL